MTVDRARGADRWPVIGAASVAAGAWSTAAGIIPGSPDDWRLLLPASAAAVVVAAVARRPALVCVALGLLAVCLTQRSLAGLVGPDGPEPVWAEATLVSDPRPTPGDGIRAEARLDGRRVALVAHRSAAAGLRGRSAGERVMIVGRLEPPGRYEEFLRHRHLAGRVRVDTVVGWRPGHGVTGAANEIRRLLGEGASSLPERQQSLLAGLTLGDSRAHPADLTEAFRRSGLVHLLVVSGSNVAYLLVVLSPLLSRLRLAPRLVVTVTALAGFALVTRGEPSVLRATTMAAIGAYSAATGTPVSGLRRLALAVGALLLIDPLLVTALGFRLSVAGAAGIIVGAGPIADRLPGPRWLTLPTAVTVAAELAVAPLLVSAFGSVPLVSLPANLLAVPVAGPVKVWGLSAGMVAGLAGEPVAGVLHLPTRLMLSWLEGVATGCAGLPVGELRAGHLVLSAFGWTLVAAGRRIARLDVALGSRAGGAVLVLGTLSAALLSGPGGGAEDGSVEIGPGMVLWRGGGAVAVVIDGRATESWLTSGLRREQVDRVDLLVLRTGAHRAVAVATELTERWPGLVVLAPPSITEPPGGRVRGAVTPDAGVELRVGGLQVVVDVRRDRLEPALTVVPVAPADDSPSAASDWSDGRHVGVEGRVGAPGAGGRAGGARAVGAVRRGPGPGGGRGDRSGAGRHHRLLRGV